MRKTVYDVPDGTALRPSGALQEGGPFRGFRFAPPPATVLCPSGAIIRVRFRDTGLLDSPGKSPLILHVSVTPLGGKSINSSVLIFLQKQGINYDKVGGIVWEDFLRWDIDAIPLSVLPAKAGTQILDDPVDCVSPGFSRCFPVLPPSSNPACGGMTKGGEASEGLSRKNGKGYTLHTDLKIGRIENFCKRLDRPPRRSGDHSGYSRR